MKTFLFIFIFALSLKADTIYDAKCVSSFLAINTSTNTKLIKITFSDTSKPIISIPYDQTVLDSLVFNMDKFYYPTQGSNFCTSKTTNTDNQVLLSSLTGILIGFTILFFAIFLTIKVGSRK